MLECFVHSQDRTTFVDGLFGLMADYSIPLSGEDSGMLSTIKTSLDSLSSSTETKKANKSVLLGKFQEELSSEVATLKENILNITQVCSKDTKLISFQIQEIESPALLDPESAYEEIKQTLERLEKSIEQVRSSRFFVLFTHNASRFAKKLSSLRSMKRSLNFQPTSIQRLMRLTVYIISSLIRFNSLARLTSIFTTSTCCGTRWTSGTHGPTTSSPWTSTRFSFGFGPPAISPFQVSASECKKVVREFGETIAELNAKDESNEVLTMLENKVRQHFVDQRLEFPFRWQASSPRFLA